MLAVGVADFAEIVVGVHGGDVAVEVGIDQGLDTTDDLGVSGDDYLGGWFGYVADEVGQEFSLNLEVFFGLEDGFGDFLHVEVVPDVDIGVQALGLEQAYEAVGEG